MKTLRLSILALCILALVQSFHSNSNAAATSSPKKKLRLAFVSNSSSDFWSLVRLGCDHAVRSLGDVDLDFRVPANPTKESQQEIVNSLVASGVDGIAVSPIDAESQTEFLNGIASKTLLICVDSDAEKSKRAGYIGTDNVIAGKQAAELLKAALPEGGKIALLVGFTNAQNTKQRIQGLQEGLAGTKIEIVDTLSDEHKVPAAYQNAQQALTKHPELSGLVGVYGYHGPAILTAVRNAGKAKQVKIVCFDEYSDTLSGIAAGDISGTVVQKTLSLGYQTISRMDGYLRGDKKQLADGKVLLQSRTVTKDNVESFQATQKSFLQGQEVKE